MRRLLLVNPAITSRRGARFPLSLMSLAAALAVLSAFERVLRPFTASLGDHFLIEAARR